MSSLRQLVVSYMPHNQYEFQPNIQFLNNQLMILELVTIDIQKGKNVEFELKLSEAEAVISQAKGFQSIEIQHCIEVENRYVLFIEWDTLEDHTEGFRNSELFTQWRALIGPFFENPPLVQHFKR